MRIIFVFSLLVLSATAEHRRNESISSFDEEMDDDVIPPYDPIWWFVRSPAEELWLRELGTEYPRIDMYGQEVSNMLQFMLLGRTEDIIMVVRGCPPRLLMQILEIRERILQRIARRIVNNVVQYSESFRFYLNHLFADGQFNDEELSLEVVYDLSCLFSNDA